MTELLGYVCGVLMHVAFKWASWKQGKYDPWSAYWKDYAALNVASGISALVCYGLWASGAIPAVLGTIANGAASLVGHTDPVPLPTGFYGSLAAGYLLDSVARTLWMALEKRTSTDK